MSRSIVRTLTSKRSAKRRALRPGDPAARNSSTSAYSRSSRFIPQAYAAQRSRCLARPARG